MEETTPRTGPRPGITVAIACCNQARFLGDAIESILAQTHRVDEIIMVDDGSHDDTAAVTARFPSVRYHYQENQGLSAARNTGLSLASHDRILFLDSDDMLLPTAIADGLEAFDAFPASAFVYGGYREVTEKRALLFERRAEVHEDALAGLLQGNHVSMHGTVIYDAAKLRAVGGFDVSLKSCEDYDVFLKLARNHPIAAYSSIGAEYRRHGSNMTGNHIRMMRISRQVVRRHLDQPGLTAAQRTAGRRGLNFMTGYYVHCALEEVAAHYKRVRHLLWGSLTTDPWFLFRLGWYVLRSVAKKVHRMVTPRTPAPVIHEDDDSALTLPIASGPRSSGPPVSPAA